MKRQRVEDIVRHCGHVFGSDNSQQQECFAEELEDGDGGDYFFARGLIPRDRVMAAREHVLQAMRDRGDLTIQANGSEIVTNGLLDRQDVAEAIKDVLEAPELVEMVKKWHCGEDGVVAVYKYKWLRAVNKGKCTGFHIDKTYLSSLFGEDGAENVISAWVPLGEITPQLGGLLVCRNGEELGLRQECEQKKLGPEGTTSGYVVPKRELLQEAGNWRTTVFEPGDVVIFRSSLVHCTMINTTDKIRLSCDVRFVCMK